MSAEYKSIEHASTVVVATNIMELAYLLAWCDENNKDVAHFMREVTDFPYCLSLNGEIVGWTNQMDRALYYKPFSEFLADTTDSPAGYASLPEICAALSKLDARDNGLINELQLCSDGSWAIESEIRPTIHGETLESLTPYLRSIKDAWDGSTTPSNSAHE